MSTPTIYKVTKEQVGREDLSDFLRRAIAKQFADKEYYVAKELIESKPTPYSKEPRQLRGYLINEGNAVGHLIWFDVTDCANNVQWLGGSR